MFWLIATTALVTQTVTDNNFTLENVDKARQEVIAYVSTDRVDYHDEGDTALWVIAVAAKPTAADFRKVCLILRDNWVASASTHVRYVDVAKYDAEDGPKRGQASSWGRLRCATGQWFEW